MHRFDPLNQVTDQISPGLRDDHHLLLILELALPHEHAFHLLNDIDAGYQLFPDQGLPDVARFVHAFGSDVGKVKLHIGAFFANIAQRRERRKQSLIKDLHCVLSDKNNFAV